MNKARMEAFSDGVIAILITIMVFDIKPPVGSDLQALYSLLPVGLTYLLSFLFLGIYWHNHHHLLQAATGTSGLVLWANSHLLFWLSLLPFTTNWLYASGFRQIPTATYGANLLLAALAYYLLQIALVAQEGPQSRLARALGSDLKGKLSLGLYLCGIGVSSVSNWCAMAVYVVVALMWLIPDRRLETRAT